MFYTTTTSIICVVNSYQLVIKIHSSMPFQILSTPYDSQSGQEYI